MASKRPIRALLTSATSPVHTPRSARQCIPLSAACPFSTSSPRSAPAYETEAADRPRWQQTPARMTAPFRTRPKPAGPEFKVNEDPKRLDDVYVKMFGPDGDKVLSEEVKWLAVTHKSFDHGRRGFNDRLAYLGRRIVSLQTSLALLSNAQPSTAAPKPDVYGRTPFTHPALSGLSNLDRETKDAAINAQRLASLAERYGLDRVLRWKPRNAGNLQGSGADVVLSSAMYAIVGAVALERGGEVANKIVRDKIMQPLGL